MTSLGLEWGPHLLSPRCLSTTSRCLGLKYPTKESRCPTKGFHLTLGRPTTTNSTGITPPTRGTLGLCGSLRPTTSLSCHLKIQENIPSLLLIKFSCENVSIRKNVFTGTILVYISKNQYDNVVSYPPRYLFTFSFESQKG